MQARRRALSMGAIGALAIAAATMAIGVLPGIAAAGAWRPATNPLSSITTAVATWRDGAGTLHVVAPVPATAPATGQSLQHGTVSAAGVPSATRTDMLGAWVAFTNPALLPDPAGMRVYFGGNRTTTTGEEFSTSKLVTATSADGGATWALDAGKSNFTGTGVADVGAALAADGTPVTTWATTFGAFVHAGFAAPTAANEFTSTDTCCGYTPNVGLDAASGNVWQGFRSNEAGKAGIWLRQVYPAAAPRVLLAESTASEVDGPLPLATQSGGAKQLWTAFCAAPTLACTKVAIARVVDGRRVNVTAGAGARHVGLAAGPAGRLWVFWAKDGAIWATRSNTGVTAFEPAQRLTLPAGTQNLWRLQGDGALGPLDLLAEASDATATREQHQRVLPALSMTLRPTSIRSSRGGNVAVRVTDAGEPVSRATVRVNGVRYRTNVLGQLTIHVARNARRGTVRVVASLPSYVPVTGTVRIRA